MNKRSTSRDKITIYGDGVTEIKRGLDMTHIILSGIGASDHITEYMRYMPDGYREMLVKDNKVETISISFNPNTEKASIKILRHPTPGIINDIANYEIDIDYVINFIMNNGEKVGQFR